MTTVYINHNGLTIISICINPVRISHLGKWVKSEQIHIFELLHIEHELWKFWKPKYFTQNCSVLRWTPIKQLGPLCTFVQDQSKKSNELLDWEGKHTSLFMCLTHKNSLLTKVHLCAQHSSWSTVGGSNASYTIVAIYQKTKRERISPARSRK